MDYAWFEKKKLEFTEHSHATALIFGSDGCRKRKILKLEKLN